MPSGKGMIALMGSGELTATMVEVHKELLGRVAAVPRAVFLDTPAGFQLRYPGRFSAQRRPNFQKGPGLFPGACAASLISCFLQIT
jgi:hypothetical protein